MQARAGAFVTLKKDGRLRGCVGTHAPVTATVAEEVIHNAIAAATRDTRFDPVRLDEVDALDCCVYVLTPTEPATPEGLDPKRYGVMVRQGSRRGVLLPDLDEVETVEEQLRLAKAKAGIFEGEPIELYRFEVKRYDTIHKEHSQNSSQSACGGERDREAP
jgi:AmmeMemoRadiSam system protein A